MNPFLLSGAVVTVNAFAFLMHCNAFTVVLLHKSCTEHGQFPAAKSTVPQVQQLHGRGVTR